MRTRRVVVVAFFILATAALAQKDQFPLIAKVVSSDTQKVQTGSSTSTTTAMPGTIWEHPQHTTTTHYANTITVTAEIENMVYGLASPQLIDPGEYPASIDKSTVRLLLKDKNGKEKTVKLHVLSVAAKQDQPAAPK